MKVSIVSPERNEKDCLEELVERVSAVMSAHFRAGDWEYIVVDDASTDGSDELLERLAKKNPNLRPCFHGERRGQTGCFKTGFDAAKGDYAITMDADLQLFPEDLPLFFEKIEQGFELVNAIRVGRKHPLPMKVASRLYNFLMWLFFRCPVSDAASNFTAIKTGYVKGLYLTDNDHRYIIAIVMSRGLKKIAEVGVRHNARKSGKSKYSAMPKYVRGFPEIFRAYGRIRSGRYAKPAFGHKG
jgi:glycosyltransferase involved in cell wall biosynthesis